MDRMATGYEKTRGMNKRQSIMQNEYAIEDGMKTLKETCVILGKDIDPQHSLFQSIHSIVLSSIHVLISRRNYKTKSEL